MKQTASRFPLTALINSLQAGPPTIGEVLFLFDEVEGREDFEELLDEFLPDLKEEILFSSHTGWTAKFTEAFSNRYFRLEDPLDYEMLSDELTLYDFCHIMPVACYGIGSEDYHDNFRDFGMGVVIVMGLCEYPYTVTVNSNMEMNGYQARIPILEYLEDFYGQELVSKIPKTGWGSEDIAEVTANTQYAGAGDIALMLTGLSPCEQLNTAFEDVQEWPDWNRAIVDNLTGQQEELKAILKRIDGFKEMANTDGETCLKELIDLMLNSGKSPVEYEIRKGYSYAIVKGR
ncbi:MAG: hypothetical protein PHF31_06915 [Methylobacter sp.]|nr:hypothetical protein [Methylobacter sp.]